MDTIDTPVIAEAVAPLTGGHIVPVPEHLAGRLVPARWIVHEWRDYWYINHHAHVVRVGSRVFVQQPANSGNYLIRFENQLGLASIRAFTIAGHLIEVHHVEVIASKFATPGHSVDFLRATLTALFAQVAAFPFVLGASTERLVREAQSPPNALFTYHFFRHNGPDLIRAVQGVLGRPHQRLTADPELVRPHEVRQIDRESLIRMLQAGRPAGPSPAGDGRRLTPLERLRPERVWQRIPAETFDTPENRFVLAICRRMLGALNELKRQAWYYGSDISAGTRARIDEAAGYLGMLTMDHRFAPLGPMVVTPTQSRVLQRKDGYRELALLWQVFQRSREPIFEHMQAAIDLRNVADLYELWVLFELINEIAEITGEGPVLVPVVDAFGIPGTGYRARFGHHGVLHYQANKRTYSGLTLIPDYLWMPDHGRWVVLDAKFRMRRPAMFLGEVTEDVEKAGTLDKAWAKTDDLTKMHAYRDAIPGVRAAVVLYPGTESVFRDVERGKLKLSLAQLLDGAWEGVGAIPMVPQGVTISDKGHEDA